VESCGDALGELLMSDVRIAPSILSADFAVLGQQVREAEAAGADWIHIDVMDGHFVPTISFGVPIVSSLRRITSLPLDVHLMIDPVDAHIKTFADAGADSITVHVEATENPARTLDTIRKCGVRPGLTLRPGTPESSVLPYLEIVDVLLVMTVEPGLAGQKFIPSMLSRIARLSEIFHAHSGERFLAVDGGLNQSTIESAVDVGAQVIVAGSSIFSAPDGIASAIKRFQTLARA